MGKRTIDPEQRARWLDLSHALEKEMQELKKIDPNLLSEKQKKQIGKWIKDFERYIAQLRH